MACHFGANANLNYAEGPLQRLHPGLSVVVILECFNFVELYFYGAVAIAYS